MEKVDMKSKYGQAKAKVVGTILCVGGAMIIQISKIVFSIDGFLFVFNFIYLSIDLFFMSFYWFLLVVVDFSLFISGMDYKFGIWDRQNSP